MLKTIRVLALTALLNPAVVPGSEVSSELAAYNAGPSWATGIAALQAYAASRPNGKLRMVLRNGSCP